MKHLCHHPWVGLDITPQGEFKPCCKYESIIDTSLSGYLNNKQLHQLRQEFLQGKRPSGCKRCWDDEDSGLPSKRQLDSKYIFQNQTPDWNSLKVLSLPFGNSCNLACRTCSTYSSSGWIAESKKLKKHLPDLVVYKHQKFYKDKQFIDQIKSLGSDLTHVEFPGGEPFLAGVSEHLDFLDFLIQCGSQNISLHYMTNATIVPDESFWHRWSKFKNVDIQLSVDGIDQHFEYLRWPGIWSQVYANIQLFQRKKTSNIQISISHTVSILNVFYLPEFVKWCLQNKLGKPYIGMVSDPTIYSVKILPREIKKIIGDKLNRFMLQEVVTYMNSENLEHELDHAVKQIQIVDQQRGQNFADVFPEFYQLLKDNKCQI